MGELVRTEGLVVAVCMSPERGFPTYPQEQVFIEELGIAGDGHSGPVRESFKNPGVFKPNDRPISIVSDEVREEMNGKFGIDMQPGDFSEQLLVRGLGDLGHIAIGAQLATCTGIIFEVVDRAWPCAKLAKHNDTRGLIKALDIVIDGERYSRRGLLTKVLEPGSLQAGDSIRIVNTP